ncbi:MAG: Gfo/Idh/MocA family oxidoreductase [Anaerolineae bacterium]|nr:Gfo/Idh/MocA family oxidoreductase [Anaerolineae bacterium]
MTEETQRIRLGIIGAGLFARQVHVPALQALADRFEIAAVCSRTPESTGQLAALLDGPVDELHDIDALLAREDIDAVDVVLPIGLMPEVVERALAAGKHVISEKPAAPTVAEGQRLLELYAGHAGQVWMVAENYRYEAAFEQAAAVVASGDLGRVLLADWAIYVNMTEENQYYHTAWRRDGSFPGGFLMDGGVHHMAGLRLVLGEVAAVCAQVVQRREDLPPADTLAASLQLESGALVAYSVTYAGGAPWYGPLQVVGERGALRLLRDGGVEVTIDGKTEVLTVPGSGGVRGEFAAFADAVQRGAAHRNTPEQAVQDVALVEAMLHSSATGQRVTPARVVR